MKTLFTLLLIVSSLSTLRAQTVTYDIPLADFSTSDCSNCDACGLAVPDLYYDVMPLIFTWTSTGSTTPTSVTVEFYELFYSSTSNDLIFNTVVDGTYSSAYNGCTPLSKSISVNYNVGSLNTFEFDYKSWFDVVWGENPAWGPGIFARVTVNYPIYVQIQIYQL